MGKLSTLPQAKMTRAAVRGVPCPDCGVSANEKCMGANDKPRASAHAARWGAYREKELSKVNQAKDHENALLDLVKYAREIFNRVNCSTGTCCCGAAMENHGNPMDCGHSPVDQGEYVVSGWCAQADTLIETIEG